MLTIVQIATDERFKDGLLTRMGQESSMVGSRKRSENTIIIIIVIIINVIHYTATYNLQPYVIV